MRYVTIPSDITLKNPRTKELSKDTKSFVSYAYEVWFNDPKANTGPLKLRAWMKMVDAFDATKPGDVVELQETDYEALKAVVEAPGTVYPPLFAIQLDAFSAAVLDAPSKDPRAEKVSEKSAKKK